MIDRPAFQVAAWVADSSGLGGGRSPILDLIGLMAREGVMQALFRRLWRDPFGQDTTEYVLAILLVALALTAGILLLPTQINELFNKAGRVLINWI